MKQLIFLFFLIPFLSFSQTQIGQDINGASPYDELGWGLSLSSDGNIVAIGADGNDDNGNNSGQVKIFENINNVWTQIGQDINGENIDEGLGYSLSLSSDGSIIAIGSIIFNSSYGKVKVFKNINNSWTQIGQDIVSEAIANGFANSLSLSSNGNVIVIGAKNSGVNGINSGLVKVFENINNVWTQKGQTLVGDGEFYQFGISTSISSDGSIIGIGAPYIPGTGTILFGYVRIYEYINNSWTQLGNTLNGLDLSLSSNGNIIAIGASGNDENGLNSGQVKVFENINNVWSQINQEINGEVIGDRFGAQVSLSSDGSILGVGYPSDVNGNNSGQVKIFKNFNNTWLQVGNTINGEFTYDYLGGRVSLSSNGSIIAVGIPLNNNTNDDITYTGQVKVFDLSLILSSDEFVLSQFSLFPNPTQSKFTIKMKEDLLLEKINIYTSLGQFINSTNNLIINISNLSTGMYYIEVLTNKGKATKQLIIE